jgi:Outer membrane protein beta-barrel domain
MLAAAVLGALLASGVEVRAQNVYVGALGGITTLSADGRSILSPATGQVSLYKPENGPALSVVAGWDFSRYVTVQGNYIWNRNDLTLVSTAFGPGGASEYQEARSSQQSSVIGDLLVYMRERGSRVRPYLSCGTGVEHFSTSLNVLELATGSLPLPPRQFSANNIALRVAVGIDVTLGRHWAFRYTFSELLSSNPISQQLTPPGLRKLKNFQSLFGLVKHF